MCPFLISHDITLKIAQTTEITYSNHVVYAKIRLSHRPQPSSKKWVVN